MTEQPQKPKSKAELEAEQRRATLEIRYKEFRRQQGSMGCGTPEEMPEGWEPGRR